MAGTDGTYNSGIIPLSLSWNDRHRGFNALQRSYRKRYESQRTRESFPLAFVDSSVHCLRNFVDSNKFNYFLVIRIYVRSLAKKKKKKRKELERKKICQTYGALFFEKVQTA